MRNELENLMAKDNLDAVIAFGSAYDPSFSYLTYGADISDAMFTKVRGGRENVWLWFMEKDNVTNAELKINLFDRTFYHEVLKETGRHDLAGLKLYLKCLDFLKVGVKRAAIYGRLEFSLANQIRDELKKKYPDLEIIDDRAPSLIDRLRATKADEELKTIKEVGKKTSAVMVETRDFIRSHKVKGKKFVKEDGSPLTVADVKRFARVKLFEKDLEDREGMIFAPGVQGTVGHNAGEADSPIVLGEQIVFDLYPNQNRGYYHDVTRTWSFGYASREMIKLYEDVLGCFNLVKSKATAGTTTGSLQEEACDYFRKRGHPVVQDDPDLDDGYNHSLGHGVGLDVHESPFIGFTDKDVLAASNVFALEPGLYYRDKKLAIRIEDTLFIDSEGHPESITDVPYDLVIPVD